MLRFIIFVFLFLRGGFVNSAIESNLPGKGRRYNEKSETKSDAVDVSVSSTYSSIGEFKALYAKMEPEETKIIGGNQKGAIADTQEKTEITVFYNVHPWSELKDMAYVTGRPEKMPEEFKELFETIAHSQFQVAQKLLNYLQKHPDAPVVIESRHASEIDKNYLERVRKENLELTTFIKDEFVGGVIPKKYKDITYDQKRILVIVDGPHLLWQLGKIEKIYRECANENQSLLYKEYYDFYDSLQKQFSGFESYDKEKASNKIASTYREREFYAIARSHQVAKKAESKNIALVYGAGHDFSHTASICKKQLPVNIKTVDCTKNVTQEERRRENVVKTDLFRLRRTIDIPCKTLKKKARSFGLTTKKAMPTPHV